MSNQLDKNSISETIADTISETEKRKLYKTIYLLQHELPRILSGFLAI